MESGMHTFDVPPTNLMHTAEQDCVPIINNTETSIWGQYETLCSRRDILCNELRGTRVGRVFGRDQFKVLLWVGANNLAVTAYTDMSYSVDTTQFVARVGVVCIVTTSGRVRYWLRLA